MCSVKITNEKIDLNMFELLEITIINESTKQDYTNFKNK